MDYQYNRIAANRHTVRPLLVASTVLSALTWLDWSINATTWFGAPYPVVVATALVANVLVTRRWQGIKRAGVAVFQRFVLNPPVRLLLRLGVPLGWSLLETVGRRSGARRVVPVGNGRLGGQFWIIAEHGTKAGYVRNIAANPEVRVLLRSGLRLRWRTGTAHVLVADDPFRRQRMLIGWTHPLRALNAMVVRVLGTDPVTVRIDLDDDRGPSALGHRTTDDDRSATCRTDVGGLVEVR